MKKRILTIFLALFVLCSHGQVIIKSGKQLSVRELEKLAFILDAPEIRLPNIDFTEIEDKGGKIKVGEPFQFGLPHNVNIGIGDGKWFEDEKGQKKRWKVKINSPKALSINLIFDNLDLPNGVELFLYSEDKSVVMGPIDFSNRGQSHEFWTDLLPGSAVVLELIGENEALEKTKLNISKVVHGYINTFSDSGGFGQSAPCNIDIDCPMGQPFVQESNAVARLLVNDGLSFCSGQL